MARASNVDGTLKSSIFTVLRFTTSEPAFNRPLFGQVVIRGAASMAGARTCSFTPDKLSNAPIYDLCGQLNHPG